jgi:hypothetical protein
MADPAVGDTEAVPAFEPPAVALRVELSGQVIAEGETVGRHPVIGEGEGRGEISRAEFRRAAMAMSWRAILV